MQIKKWRHGKTAVIIGDPAHFGPRRLAAFWRSQGLDVAIVTRKWQGPLQCEDGTKILQSCDAESSSLHEQLAWLQQHWRRIEQGVRIWERSRYLRAMGPLEHRDYNPSFTKSLIQAASIPQFVAQLDPAFVFGQEAFAYGLATALCTASPKVLMPWGGDIFSFAESSSIAFAMVRRALHGVDLVVPSAVVGARLVTDVFGVPSEKVRAVSWGVDRELFRKASREGRHLFCATHNIDPSSILILNVRRFLPRWGWNVALEAFIRLAEEDEKLKFFALGGPGSEPFIAEARMRISAKALERRITIFDGHISDSAVQELFSVADIFTSLVPVSLNDMRSSSILEGAAAGATPVLSDIAEYREMERLGFRALFVEKLETAGVVATLRRAIQEPALRAEIAAANERYLDAHEDSQRNQLRLLDLIDGLPVRMEERSPPGISDVMTVIDEIIGARKHLGLLSNLVRLHHGCRHPLRSARMVWRDLRASLSSLTDRLENS